MGAMTLLKAKKYWTFIMSVNRMKRRSLPGKPYLGVGDAQEWQLEQEIDEKANHSSRRNTLVFGDMIGDILITGPNGCKQDGHALSASRGLDTV